MISAIRAGVAVIFDGTAHKYVRDVTIELADGRVSSIHDGPPLASENVIDASQQLVFPGFVNLHTHAGVFAHARLRSDNPARQAFGEGFLATAPVAGRSLPEEDLRLATRHTLWQLARWGSTTAVDVGSSIGMCEALVEANHNVGLRLFVGPRIVDAEYVYDASGVLTYEWDLARGDDLFGAAADFLTSHHGAQEGLVRGIVVPWQADTCTPQRLQDCVDLARKLDAPLQVHVSQNLFEFHELVRRTGLTPVGYLAQSGALTDRTVLAHAIFLSGTPHTRWPDEGDSELVASTGAHVAHCPSAYVRLGYPVLGVDWYLGRGINLGLGTDSYPRDIVDEMRFAAAVGKLSAGDAGAAQASTVFHAATVGAASALGRPDLGRILPGARADFCIVDPAHPRMGGVIYDPVRSLVECGVGEVVSMTVVDGQVVYDGQRVRGIADSPRSFYERLQVEAQRTWGAVPDWHWTGKPVGEAFPPALETVSLAAVRDTWDEE